MQAAPTPGAIPVLTLKDAIARAMEKNRQLAQRRLSLDQANLSYESAWTQMFVPQANFSLSSTSSKGVADIPSSVQTPRTAQAPKYGYPSSTANLTLGSYTLFNFWKDWAQYERARLQHQRSQEEYQEAVRTIRFDTTNAYFSYKNELEKVDAAKRSVTMAQSIVELVKSRLRLNQGSSVDVKSAEVDLGTAKDGYYTQAKDSKNRLFQLNLILGDTLGTEYSLSDLLKYYPLRINIDDAVRIHQDSSPIVRSSVLSRRNAEIDVEVQEKNRIPLPQVQFSGVTFSFGNGYYGSSKQFYGGQSDSVEMEVSATVSLSLPIYGPDGLFGHRRVQQARNTRDMADLQYQDVLAQGRTNIYSAVEQIRAFESQIDEAKKSFKSSAEVLEEVFIKSSKEKISRLEFRDAINQARTSEIHLRELEVNHLQSKLGLANLIGVDHLPGDPY